MTTTTTPDLPAKLVQIGQTLGDEGLEGKISGLIMVKIRPIESGMPQIELELAAMPPMHALGVLEFAKMLLAQQIACPTED